MSKKFKQNSTLWRIYFEANFLFCYFSILPFYIHIKHDRCKLFYSLKVLFWTRRHSYWVLSTIDLVFLLCCSFQFRITWVSFNGRPSSNYLSSSLGTTFVGIQRRYISIVQTSNKFFFKNLLWLQIYNMNTVEGEEDEEEE